MIGSVHQANKEKFTGEFDICAEQEALSRICRDETIQVAEVMGDMAAIASRSGIVNMVASSSLIAGEPIAGTYIVYFWHGRMYNVRFRRQGTPYSFGPYETQFYNRDRVAEILAKHKESLK